MLSKQFMLWLSLIVLMLSISVKAEASDIKVDIKVKDSYSRNAVLLTDSVTIETSEGKKKILLKKLCHIVKSPKGVYSFKFVWKDETGEFWGNFIDNTIRYKTGGGPQQYNTSDIDEISLCSPIKIKTELSVYANVLWTSTGINVKKGHQYSITASGTWKGCSNGQFMSANGCGQTPCGNYNSAVAVLNADCLSLVGRIGSHGKAFFIGESKTFKAKKNGKLYLGPNDSSGGLENNQGSLNVEIICEY